MDVGSLGSSLPTSAGFESLGAARLGPDLEGGLRAALSGDTSAEEAASKLEGLFATMLVKEMRNALSTGFFGEGSTGDIYGGWFDEHVGNALARDGALNLAGMIKANLSAKSAAEAGDDTR